MENPSLSISSQMSIKRIEQQVNNDEKVTNATSATTSATNLHPNAPITTSKYIRDFEALFVPINVDKLRTKAQYGNLRHCQFRSLCWRYFLRCLPAKYDDWLGKCKESRLRYIDIRAKHLSTVKTDPDSMGDNRNGYTRDAVNHISSNIITKRDDKDIDEKTRDDCQYAKASKECDYKNTYKTIERDVVRTFPGMEFFRQTDMQDILRNILFNFARENPHLSYKQGMHELLATLLYVAHTDSQNCLINVQGDYANETIATLLDPKYLEHDVYYLFSALMKSIESWYQNDEILVVSEQPRVVSSPPPAPPNNRYATANIRSSSISMSIISSSSSSTGNRQQVGSVLGIKLKMISENIVRKYDSELFNHLEALQIAPQIYGIRWMRLLFGREFEFLDLLAVWDAVICDKDPMSLVDYVFASMLMTIREELVNGDYTDCLNNLMRHQYKDVPYVIRLALHLRDPINNIRPRQNKQQHSKARALYSHSTRDRIF